MKNIKKFNEHFTEEITDGKFDFDSDDQTITMDTIKESIIESIKERNNEVDVNDPKFAEGIDDLTKMIMSSFQETLSYISEHYEGEIEDILSLDDNY